jgi:BlaI family transcriptional regulator, penicillinase repressor
MRNNPNRILSLPPLELECMKALWALGEANVHGIRGRMWASRPLAYTTVMTVMDRLGRKGMVERRREGRFHVYRPLVPAEELREHAVSRLVHDFFLGSREALQQYLEGNGSGNPAGVPPALVPEPRRETARPQAEVEAQSAPAAQESIDPSLL